ncbi:MAG: hypothetical protein ACREOR_10210 [Candidatus Binatia bacterium]
MKRAKFAVRETLKRLPDYRFVFKTDVKSFYASIDHDLLLDRLVGWVEAPCADTHGVRRRAQFGPDGYRRNLS